MHDQLRRCDSQTRLDFSQIDRCANGPVGTQLMIDSSARSKRLGFGTS